jgi:hypothetical protein
MPTNSGVIDLIERACSATPYCVCGSHTVPAWRDGIVWLDCATLVQPPAGRIQRLINSLAPHVHEPIVDLGENAVAA